MSAKASENALKNKRTGRICQEKHSSYLFSAQDSHVTLKTGIAHDIYVYSRGCPTENMKVRKTTTANG